MVTLIQTEDLSIAYLYIYADSTFNFFFFFDGGRGLFETCLRHYLNFSCKRAQNSFVPVDLSRVMTGVVIHAHAPLQHQQRLYQLP